MTNHGTAGPFKAELAVVEPSRLDEERMGVGVVVKIEDKNGAPLEWPFRIIDEKGEDLSRTSTNPDGSFNGEYVLNLRKGFQERLQLTLEQSELTDSKVVPEIRELTEEEEQQQQEREEAEKVRQAMQKRERYLAEMASIFEGRMSIKNRVVRLEQGEYLVPGVIVIDKGGALEIPEGVVLRFGREGGIRCSYNGYVPLWYTFFSEQLRSAVLRVMPRRLTCRLPERPVEADKVVGGNAPNHT